MAANKFLSNVAGKIKEVFGQQTSAGIADANKIVALDATGKLDISLLPPGVAAETVVAITSENLTAGNFVNLYDNAGTLTLRKADATTTSKPAHGFVIANSTSPASNTMYILGVQNAFQAGMTVGIRQFLSTTPGGVTATAPSTAGNLVQELGIALSATEILTIDGVSSSIEVA